MSIFSSALLTRRRPAGRRASALLSFMVATAVGFIPGPRLDDGAPPAPESTVAEASPRASTAPGGAAQAEPPASRQSPQPANRQPARQPSGSGSALPGDEPGDETGGEALLGNDVSWPQCSGDLPDDPAFAIVGVNNGLANTTNPCLHQQLDWADDSAGGTGQPRLALYVNTANPGLRGSWWPTNNEYGGEVVANPYGTCQGQDDAACAYMYGYAKAFDDAYLRTISEPGTYLWWLDVETGNSWSGDRNANRADLEGMADFFHSIGARVGIYSSARQWGQIVGEVGSASSLYSLPSWLAGARTAAEANSMCSAAPLTAGGRVVLTQFVADGFDHDHSCI
ncbi:hypothetical protein [uncultured Arthrobacter sp.]|uniref:hypothetical protein n=1 Tax=uncultured Arthrobacter sp. TaxID=114050 RepID=UPI0028D5A387|nr:hypothetical protein [uncultured Arthrobacter sp.]